MNILPTLEGGLRLDVQDPEDWLMLACITHDAVSCDENLAQRLGKLITDPQMGPDWREFVVPDLENAFLADVQHVTTAIASARLESGGGPGLLWITPDDAMSWYSALNQARLAIEERFHFGPNENIDLASLPIEHRSAYFRSDFYWDVQYMLLKHVMR